MPLKTIASNQGCLLHLLPVLVGLFKGKEVDKKYAAGVRNLYSFTKGIEFNNVATGFI